MDTSDAGIKRPFPDEGALGEAEKRQKTNGEGWEAGQGGNGEPDFTKDGPDLFSTGETEDGWDYSITQPRGGKGFRFPRFPPRMRGPPPPWARMRMRMRPPFIRGAPRGGPRGMRPFFRGPVPPPFWRPGPPPPPVFHNVKNMTLPEKFEALGFYLTHIDMRKAPPVTTLWNAAQASRLGLELDYDTSDMPQVAGRPMFTGALKINGLFIVRAIGTNKKEVKQDVYHKAMHMIMSKSGEEIQGQVDPGCEQLKKEMEEQILEDAARDLGTAVDEPTILERCDDPEVLIAVERMVAILKTMKFTCNNEIISMIEKAISQVQPRPNHDYSVEEIRLSNGRLYFLGRLKFGPLVIGRGNGFNKKGAKFDTYKKCWERLTTMNLDELAVSVPEESKLDIDKTSEAPKKIKAISRDLPIEERLGVFLTSIATPDETSFVKTMDVAAFHASLTLTIIYRTKQPNVLKPQMECDIFIEGIFLSHCEKKAVTNSGSMKRDVMMEAYKKAWETASRATVDDLLKKFRRVNDNDLWGPYMITVTRKGAANTIDSNVTNLKRYGHDLSKIGSNRLQDIVLLEQGEWSHDRQKFAYNILNLSCMQNGLLLQWETESLLNTYSNVNSRCQVYIQRQKVGDSYGIGKAQAKELAFKETLYKLYETQPVIRMVVEGDERNWITYESMEKEAEEMKNKGIRPELPVRDEEGNQLSGYVTKVAYEKIKRFAEKKKGEIIFGPGLTSDEGKEIRYIARLLNLKCDIRAHMGQPYMMFFKHIEWSKLVGRLTPTAGLYGKYFRVPEQEIPTYGEIEKQIIKEPAKKGEDSKEEKMDTSDVKKAS